MPQTPIGPRVVLVTPDDLAGELLAIALQHRGLVTVARCATPSAAPAAVARGAEVLLRLVTLVDNDVDLAELERSRTANGTLGLVLLTTALDLRLLGVTIDALPLGTRVLCSREAGGLARLADAIESAARRPLAAQRRLARLPLTDEQVDALRCVAGGMSNEEIARRRSTSVGAARALVVRTARSLGIRTDGGPSQMRAELAAAYVRLLGGGRNPRALNAGHHARRADGALGLAIT